LCERSRKGEGKKLRKNKNLHVRGEFSKTETLSENGLAGGEGERPRKRKGGSEKGGPPFFAGGGPQREEGGGMGGTGKKGETFSFGKKDSAV